MAEPTTLRIVLASPGDVQTERDRMPGVIEELNRGIAAACGFRLTLTRWETDSYPGFHAGGPQGVIDPVLKIEDCDILLGVFWHRFGTPTPDAGSGTEHEFRNAVTAWKARGRPQIMVYFNEAGPQPRSAEAKTQFRKVQRFRRTFPKEGLWASYEGADDFEKKVRNHLTNYLRERKAAISPQATSPAARPLDARARRKLAELQARTTALSRSINDLKQQRDRGFVDQSRFAALSAELDRQRLEILQGAGALLGGAGAEFDAVLRGAIQGVDEDELFDRLKQVAVERKLGDGFIAPLETHQGVLLSWLIEVGTKLAAPEAEAAKA